MFFVWSVVLLAVSSATANDLCCLPGQFEMQEGTNLVLDNGQVTSYICHSTADFSGRNMVSSDCQMNLPKQSTFRKIDDLKRNVSYYVDLAKKTCIKSTLAGRPNQCVPDGEKMLDYYVYFGQPSQPFGVESYAVKYNTVTVYLGVRRSSKENECLVISNTMVQQAGMRLRSTGYFNYTLGISDPSVFDIPTYCNGDSDGPLKYHPHKDWKVTTFV